MAKKEFQAESKKLMDMMINSIYTNKEIFLRELISNASDAIDKLYYKSLTDPSVGMNKGDFRILITRDQENRILTIEDNGIGMTKEELEQNLGTIAHSGSLDFKKDNKDENIDIIGQFGVGFYSSFMVADKVTVISKAYGSDEAWQWESSGVDGYEMTPAQKDTAGTQIILHIKPDTETDHYDNFLDEYGIVAIVKKYSDYVRYPIQMERQHERQKPEPDPKPEDYKPEWETYTELETLNSMVPIWKKQKSEVTDEEYANFYKEKFGDYTDPARVIVSRTEGTANYNALLFVPSHRPYDFYTKDYEKGLALYASGVLIMEKCADLLPDYFSFVKGIVDSQDLSLNISREMLQKDNQLKLIHNALEKRSRTSCTPCWPMTARSTRNSGKSSAVRSSSVLTPTTACTPSCFATCCCSGLPRSRRWSLCRSMWTRCPLSRSISTLLPVILPTVWQSCPPLSWSWIRAMTSCC